jgi:hypothetical protein
MRVELLLVINCSIGSASRSQQLKRATLSLGELQLHFCNKFGIARLRRFPDWLILEPLLIPLLPLSLTTLNERTISLRHFERGH